MAAALVDCSRNTSGREVTQRERSPNARFYTGILLLSLPLGLVAYIGAGMIAAILRGGGHFYSVPFGGYTASNDAALATSAVVWIGVVFICLAVILRLRK
jgi:hypothetical protein